MRTEFYNFEKRFLGCFDKSLTQEGIPAGSPVETDTHVTGSTPENESLIIVLFLPRFACFPQHMTTWYNFMVLYEAKCCKIPRTMAVMTHHKQRFNIF